MRHDYHPLFFYPKQRTLQFDRNNFQLSQNLLNNFAELKTRFYRNHHRARSLGRIQKAVKDVIWQCSLEKQAMITLQEMAVFSNLYGSKVA